MQCKCGCGQIVIGAGIDFKKGHHMRSDEGARQYSASRTKNSPTPHGDGYLTKSAGFRMGHKLLHRAVVETELNITLSPESVVHHIDGNRSNNDVSNLMVCKNDTEHRRVHREQRALEACGHEDWRKCSFCQQWDDPTNLYIPPKNGTIEHRACGNEYRKQQKLKGVLK